MAAHLKTGIEQVLESIKNNTLDKTVIWGCVNLVDCWTADMIDGSVYDSHWNALNDWLEEKITADRLAGRLEVCLYAVEYQWACLGMPKTREEWITRHWEKNDDEQE